MFRACGAFLISVHLLLCKIFGFIARYVYSSKADERNGSCFSANHSEEDDQFVSKNSTGFLSGGLAENTILGGRESKGDCSNTEDSVFLQSEFVAKHNMYQFRPIEDVIGFVEEPGTVRFSVQEMFLESDEHLSSVDHEISSRRDYLEEKLQEFDGGIESSDPKKEDCPSGEQVYPEKENSVTDEDKVVRFEGIGLAEDELMEEQDFCYEIELLPRSRFAIPEASDFTEFKFLFSPQKLKPIDKSFLNVENDHRKPEDTESNAKERKFGLIHLDLDDEFIELEPKNATGSPTHTIEERFCSAEANHTEELHELEMSFEGSEEHKSWDSDTEDDDGHDALWEHQHLVQQMRMELRNCRIRGLPTISEDCETPKVVEDLKPLKIDHKFEYKDVMEEIHKFYKRYAEKMRKLDILNFQTLQAIGLLKLKDSEQFTAGKKKAASLRKSLNFPKIWPCKVQRIYADPTLRSTVELNHDLELVYIGQLCLSWEILGWLYLKAKELVPYDSQGSHSYNRVAEEFQQFQVLMQRFMEDEPFQGLRMQNYVRNRCVIRSLLQVPIIRDDCVKDKKERKEERDAISLDMLLRTIKDSMLVFWEFLGSDKCSKDVASNINLQKHADSVLIVDMITSLQKKERRLRENIRSKKCIVKKLQKQKECEQGLSCEVELRLVSRVLRLSRLSGDQLAWCKDKLDSINFVNRRVHLEPSFLLFPC